MLMPRRFKYRKWQRMRMKGKSLRSQKVDFGDYGLYSKELGIMTGRQIEAVRVCMNRALKRGGKVYSRVFPNIPYTKKPAETRMGKGKGNVEFWICKIKPGQVLFEVSGVEKSIAKNALKVFLISFRLRQDLWKGIYEI